MANICGVYDVESSLGKGTLGKVIKATKDGRPYVVKQISKSDIEQETTKGRSFTNMVKAMKSAKSKRLQTIKEQLSDNYADYAITNYLEQPNLTNFVGGKPLQLKKSAAIVADILRGLQDLHSTAKTFHLNLKPNNIFVFDNQSAPNVVLTDYSLLQMDEDNQANLITIEHMAPELFSEAYTYQAEVWSVGVVFFYMLTGNFPFSKSDIIHQRVSAKCNSFSFKAETSKKNLQLSSQDASNLEKLFARIFEMEYEDRIGLHVLKLEPLFVGFFKNTQIKDSEVFYSNSPPMHASYFTKSMSSIYRSGQHGQPVITGFRKEEEEEKYQSPNYGGRQKNYKPEPEYKQLPKPVAKNPTPVQTGFKKQKKPETIQIKQEVYEEAQPIAVKMDKKEITIKNPVKDKKVYEVQKPKVEQISPDKNKQMKAQQPNKDPYAVTRQFQKLNPRLEPIPGTDQRIDRIKKEQIKLPNYTFQRQKSAYFFVADRNYFLIEACNDVLKSTNYFPDYLKYAFCYVVTKLFIIYSRILKVELALEKVPPSSPADCKWDLFFKSSIFESNLKKISRELADAEDAIVDLCRSCQQHKVKLCSKIAEFNNILTEDVKQKEFSGVWKDGYRKTTSLSYGALMKALSGTQKAKLAGQNIEAEVHNIHMMMIKVFICHSINRMFDDTLIPILYDDYFKWKKVHRPGSLIKNLDFDTFKSWLSEESSEVLIRVTKIIISKIFAGH